MIYLDHNATTPVLPKVVEAMLPWLQENWGNPSSIYGPGRLARRAVEEARERVAKLVGAHAEQVIFTSGATEANNAALHSAVFRDPTKRHVVTSAVEHSAVLAYCDYLERIHGIEITRLPVDFNGELDPTELRAAIRPDTAVAALMTANNETGVIWPISKFAAICAELQVPLHSDAVQAIGKIPVSFDGWRLSSMAISGHKFGAPKGIGALIIAEPQSFLPLIHGGKQERGSRGGTEGVAQIVGLGAAAESANELDAGAWERVAILRDEFEASILDRLGGSQINGGKARRLPNTSNIHLPWSDGDAAVTYLDQMGICISSGSACLEEAITPSHVLMEMSDSYEIANESIRVSLGQTNREAQIEQLLQALEKFAGVIT